VQEPEEIRRRRSPPNRSSGPIERQASLARQPLKWREERRPKKREKSSACTMYRRHERRKGITAAHPTPQHLRWNEVKRGKKNRPREEYELIK